MKGLKRMLNLTRYEFSIFHYPFYSLQLNVRGLSNGGIARKFWWDNYLRQRQKKY